MQKVADAVRPILAGVIGIDVEEITENCSLVDDLGADSLDVVETIIAYEDAHGVQIDDGGEQITTFSELVSALALAKHCPGEKQ